MATARERNRALAKEVRRGIIAAKQGLEAWIASAEKDKAVHPRDVRLAKGIRGILVTTTVLLAAWSSEEPAGVVRPGDSRTLHQ